MIWGERSSVRGISRCRDFKVGEIWVCLRNEKKFRVVVVERRKVRGVVLCRFCRRRFGLDAYFRD